MDVHKLPKPSSDVWDSWLGLIRVDAPNAEISQASLTSLYWTFTLSRALIGSGLLIETPGAFLYAAGDLDGLAEGLGFGLVVFVDADTYPSPEAAVRSSDRTAQLEIPFRGKIEGLESSIVTLPVRQEMHLAPTQPLIATAGCWGVSRCGSNRSRGPGLVTAAHVLSGRPKHVLLEGGKVGFLLDRGPGITDVALVSCSDPPTNLTPLPVAPYVAVGDQVDLETKSGEKDTRVALVTHDFGMHRYASIPARFYIVPPGEPGDSGALVRHRGRAVGFYVGAFTDEFNHTWGDVQNAHQVCELMDMRLSK